MLISIGLSDAKGFFVPFESFHLLLFKYVNDSDLFLSAQFVYLPIQRLLSDLML